jgi:catechol 2,3-dioxygenase-like lactoylglutathione lyase family enzyme
MTTALTEAASAVATRFHVGLHVADLTRSVRFYRALFGTEPAKHFDDYAKFDVAEPPLVLALYPNPQQPGGALNHVGLRLPDSEALVEVQRRLEEAGIPTQRQEDVECCYARQTKFWVTDPDRTLWELYTLHEDIDHSGFDDPPAPSPPAAEVVWQHRLTDALPDRIPHADGTVDEVTLEGTFNAAVPTDRVAALIAEAHRALKPGGRIAVHGLVGDRPFPGTPKLPGLAWLVQRVPGETEPLEVLRRAGFGGLFYEKLGDIHCFSVNGVELRELRLQGWKPAAAAGSRSVMYKGPFEEVADEGGITFRRGERVTVPAAVAERLRAGPAADQLAFLPES